MNSIAKPSVKRPAIRLHNLIGGVHPPEQKSVSNGTPIQTPALPSQLFVPIGQHIGQAAKPCVNVGDHVLKGQAIALSDGFVSTSIHAPTSGTVTAIAEHPVQTNVLSQSPCIVVDTDGEDQWVERSPWEQFSIKQLDQQAPLDVIEKIRDYGIAGLGGAGFPTAVKVSVEASRIDTLIINGIECEPYITADDLLMRERAHEIICGTLILAHLVKPERILIGIEDNKPEAISAMTQALDALITSESFTMPTHIVSVPTKYPSGGEKQLIQILTGLEVPSGGLPADLGILCQNTGTAAAIYDAIVKDQPLVSRITTVTGAAVKKPGNFEALLGTPVSHLLECAQADPRTLKRLVMGGPMMGFALETPAVPIIKTTNCILAATAEELPDPAQEQPCIRCGLCAEACPASLLPQQLYWYSKSHQFEQAQRQNLMDCIECGACAYVCPSQIPLVQYYRFAKSEIRRIDEEHTKAEHSRERFERRNERLAREAAEKEAKRKARAEAAAAKKAQQAAKQKAEAEASAGKPDEKTAVAASTATADNNGLTGDAERLLKLQTTAAQTMKKWKDANKALVAAESKAANDEPSDEEQLRLEKMRKKVTALKAAADIAQQAWQKEKSS